MNDSSKDPSFGQAPKPLTVYLGESGNAHDSQRVDILPHGVPISVSVDATGVRICDISGGEQTIIWSVEYDDLPVR